MLCFSLIYKEMIVYLNYYLNLNHIQDRRGVSAIIVTDNYLCYKELKSPCTFFSYFNI